METKFIKYPSIEQFRTIEKDVKYLTRFKCLDENEEPIFDESITLPILNFNYTIKLHGTNAGITYNTQTEEIVFMSRTSILSEEKDNAGFYVFGTERKDEFLSLFRRIKSEGNISNSLISIYGEFCGKKIQSGVGISKIDKSLFVFAVKLTKENEETWLDIPDYIQGKNIYNINNYETGIISIDFNDTKPGLDELNKILQRVEHKCPVASVFLPNEDKLIGEGLVLKTEYKDKTLIFKHKGEEHSKSRSKRPRKKLTQEELERLSVIDICVNKIFSIPRCNQALVELFGYNFENTIDIKRIGEYLKWVSKDTLKEELDVIESYTLAPNEVIKGVQKLAKEYFFDVFKGK